MNQERIYKVLLAPHVSEKATLVNEQSNQFVFKVAKDATKPEIRKAIETLWGVKVKSVSTAVVKGKSKRFGRTMGKRSDWKKAYVALEAGHDIDLLGTE